MGDWTKLRKRRDVWCIWSMHWNIKGSDWSVWTFYKPHLAPTGAEKTAGGSPVLMDCLRTTCWKSLNSVSRCSQIRSKWVCWKSTRMVCEDLWVKKKCMQFYLDIWMYTLSVRVCALCWSIMLIPLYESHGHTKQFCAIELNTLLHMLYTLFDNCENLQNPVHTCIHRSNTA